MTDQLFPRGSYARPESTIPYPMFGHHPTFGHFEFLAHSLFNLYKIRYTPSGTIYQHAPSVFNIKIRLKE
jgi:hypothetical protein